MTDLSIRHILFPFDFSPQGRQAARYVGAFARRFGARLTIVTVAPSTAEGARETSRCQLDREHFDAFTDIETARVAECGDPALRIVDFAHDQDVDLVMMPTHGLGMFRAVLMGSATSKVLHDVRCPVWTAAHAENQDAFEVPRVILCAVDGSTEGVALLQHAALLARKLSATLKVLHVVEPVSDWLSLPSERRLQNQVLDIESEAVASMLTAAGVEATSRVVVGSIVERAAEAAREECADLVVVGRGVSGAPFGRIRTHSFGIIEHSPCPVLSV